LAALAEVAEAWLTTNFSTATSTEHGKFERVSSSMQTSVDFFDYVIGKYQHHTCCVYIRSSGLILASSRQIWPD
jgi:hypothetical protein